MLAVIGALVVAVLSWFIFDVYAKGQKLSSIPRVPRPPGVSGVLLGNLQDLTNKRYHRTSFAWTQRCGKIARLRVLWSHIVLVADPVIITDLLRDKTWDKSKKAYSVMNALFDGKGHASLLTDQMTPKWKAVRKGVAQAFSPQNLREGFPQVRQVLYQVVDHLQHNGAKAPVDVDALCSGAMWDAIGFVGFKTNMHATIVASSRGGQSNILSSIQAGMAEIETRWTLPFRGELFRHLLPGPRQGHQDLLKVHAIIRDLLTRVRSYPPESLGNTIAGHLLRVKDPETGLPLSDDLLVPEIGTMFLAGFETSSHTEAWALYLISQHPEVEARILQELAEHGLVPVDGAAARDIQYEDLARLTYLGCVIKEVLRLYPVAPSTDRVAEQDMQVGGHFIPKGTSIWISLYAIQRSPDHWDDPEMFKPERWLDPSCMYTHANPTEGETPGTDRAKESPALKQRKGSVKGDSDGGESDSSWVKPSRPPSPAPESAQDDTIHDMPTLSPSPGPHDQHGNQPGPPQEGAQTPLGPSATPLHPHGVRQAGVQSPPGPAPTPLDQRETGQTQGRIQSPPKQGKGLQDQARRWLPFSDGPRSCVGQPLAYINVTATLAILLARFHFRLADKMGGPDNVAKRERVTITLAPAGGLWMHAQPRR